MAEDRNVLEQQAMALLQKDKVDAAIAVYLKILKLSKGDYRVRQKLADLYLGQGRKPEAIRQLRDVASGLIKDGQERPAVVVLKNLHKLNPTDAQTVGILGDCQMAVGFESDAKEAYTLVIDMLEEKPKEALPYIKKLMKLAPGEMPPKIKLAEALFRTGDKDGSFSTWSKLGHEARRRGIAVDQASFYERALRLEETDAHCLERAAEARITLGAPKEALIHIQKAYSIDPSSTAVLSMLAQCFELMDQAAKAKKVLLQLAKLYDDMGNPVDQLDALSRASKCDPEDATLEAQIGHANQMADRVQMRLSEQKWAAPGSVEEIEVVLRAQILAEYGFPDRSKETLEGADEAIRSSLSVRATLAEVLVQLEDKPGAIAEAEQITENGATAQDIATRISVLRGEYAEPIAVEEEGDVIEMDIEDDDEVIEMDIEDDDEVIEMDIEDDEDDASEEEEAESATDADDAELEAKGDALAAAGEHEAAIDAYRLALDADPANEAVLMKLGELIAAGDEDFDPMDIPLEALEEVGDDADMPSLSGIMGGAKGGKAVKLASVPEPSAPEVEDDDALSLARGRLLLGQYDQVADALEGRDDLPAAILIAEARAAAGEPKHAFEILQEVVDEVDDDEPGYLDALWGLARYTARLGKKGKAKRLLKEIAKRDSGYRAVEAQALKRGIEQMKKG